MKIVLFRTDWRSFFSIVISIVTKENYSHAALLYKGKLYDASEKRKSGAGFGGYLKDYGSRGCEIYDIGKFNINQFLKHNKGVKYDWEGVFGWLFHKDNPRKLYCYEYVLKLLVFIDIIGSVPPTHKHTASEIKRILNSKPQYSGKASSYAQWRKNEIK